MPLDPMKFLSHPIVYPSAPPTMPIQSKLFVSIHLITTSISLYYHSGLIAYLHPPWIHMYPEQRNLFPI